MTIVFFLLDSDVDLIREAIDLYNNVQSRPHRIVEQESFEIRAGFAIPAFRRVLLKYLRCENPARQRAEAMSPSIYDVRPCGLCDACKLITLLEEKK